MSNGMEKLQELIQNHGVGAYFGIAGIFIFVVIGFISPFLVIGMVIKSLISKNWSNWRKWKYIGYLLLLGIGLLIISVIIAMVRGGNTAISNQASTEVNEENTRKVTEMDRKTSLEEEINLKISEQGHLEEKIPMTILDYYYALPASYFTIDDYPVIRDDEKARKEAILTLDEKNYYVDFSDVMKSDAHGTMAVFIKPNGTHIIAVDVRACGPLCHQELRFFLYDSADQPAMPFVFKDVTPNILPNMNEIRKNAIARIKKILIEQGEDENSIAYSILFRIPREGTTLDVYDMVSGIVLYQLAWIDGKFIGKEVLIMPPKDLE